MVWQFIGLDFDGSLMAQKAILERLDKLIDCQSLQSEIRLWATRHGQRKLRNAISDLNYRRGCRLLTLTGSADYRHLSSLLLETLPKDLLPINLVLIDHQTAWTKLPPSCHFRHWLSTILEQPWIESVVAIGLGSEVKNIYPWLAPLDHMYSGRLRLYPYSQECLFIPLAWPRQVRAATGIESKRTGTNMYFKTIESKGFEKVASEIAASLNQRNVYLSIGKNVLSADYALTDSPQGKLRFPELSYLINKLADNCNLVGADIGGEMAMHSFNAALKLVGLGSMWQSKQADFDKANTINEATNLKLLDIFTKIADLHALLEKAGL